MRCAIAGVLCSASGVHGQPQALGVRDTIETAELLTPYVSGRELDSLQRSPTGDRYVFVTLRGDIAADGNWVELFSGRTSSVADARPKLIARLFTRARSKNLLRSRPVKWFAHGSAIAFTFKRNHEPRQVYGLNLETGELKCMTASDVDVLDFDISESGLIVFGVRAPILRDTDARLTHEGFAATHQELWDLLSGEVSAEEGDELQLFMQSPENRVPRRIPFRARRTIFPSMSIVIAPDEKNAVLTAPPADIPSDWNNYDSRSWGVWLLGSVQPHPNSATSVSQYWIVDLATVQARPLFRAPRNAPLSALLWSPDGRSLAVGPTFLPRSFRGAGLEGKALALIEPETGSVTELPVPPALWGEVRPLEWKNPHELLVGNERVRLLFRRLSGRWGSAPLPSRVRSRKPSGIRVAIRQSLNDPPALEVANSGTRQAARLYEIAPELKNRTRAHVEVYQWADETGRAWIGTLYRAGEARTMPVPLVIQIGSGNADLNRFSLQGLDVLTGNAAQPLANSGIAVLNMFSPVGGFGEDLATPREPLAVMQGVHAAVRLLGQQGVVDPSRVGLFGFSRTGWYVLYIVTHSDQPFAAVNVCDNFDGSYLQYILSGPDTRSELERDIGAAPIGPGLAKWLEGSPGFRTELIRGALRMERDEGVAVGLGVVLGGWEVFSRMRANHQPVELYVVPDVTEGEHLLEGPRQQLASRSATVDWFDFWLNGHEDPDGSKADQYRRWEELCDLQRRRTPERPAFCIGQEK